MSRALVFTLVAVLFLSACSGGDDDTAEPAPVTTTTVKTPANLAIATVDSASQQTIDGFGASGAWWPNDLVNFPQDVQALVADMLFSPSGIQLSGYRYNIGGGGVGVTNPVRAPKQFPDDTAGRTFLALANERQVPLLTGFVNSAPTQFTTNAKNCGGELKPGSEADFAQYLAGIVDDAQQDGITLDYISPMNEPDDSFGSCGQEGMIVPVDQRAAVVQALGAALKTNAPDTQVIADETTADAILANEAPEWLKVPGTTDSLAAIAHHTYDFPNDALRKLVPPIAKQAGKPTWMTEICCYKGSGGIASSFGANYDPTMTQALWLVNQIYDDFTVAGDSAWYWWTALSPVLGCKPKDDPTCVTKQNDQGFNDGLLYYDEDYATSDITTIFPTKRFYALGQFSRYVRPGAQRHNLTGKLPKDVRAMAFVQDRHWSIVAWNGSRTATQIGLELPADAPTEVNAVITNEGSNLQTAPEPARTDTGARMVDLPAESIVTVTFT
jgi:O-glycosyl hydrolase